MKRKKKKKKYTVSFTLPCWHGCVLLYTFSPSWSTFEYVVVTVPSRPCKALQSCVPSNLAFRLLQPYCCVSSEIFSCVHHLSLSQLCSISSYVTKHCVCICTYSIRHQQLPFQYDISGFPSVSCLCSLTLTDLVFELNTHQSRPGALSSLHQRTPIYAVFASLNNDVASCQFFPQPFVSVWRP